ncbi:hypothetical protein ACSL103130_08680 [Actinomyces slackii]|uniref:Uncharacterized protein n=1 Tax=Actinomyces slackii TaxID=52774 RepID=A0A448KBR7_9ACTO|nr:hypothetical protein [Actinomyces slackii]VEG74361.1 Uncharacterised protein [Actinomyces slackii]
MTDGQSTQPAHAQGTGFIHLNDPQEMRLITLWKAEAADGWETTFKNWNDGALNLRARDRAGRRRNASSFWRAGYVHPEVAARLLDPGNRRSKPLDSLADYAKPTDPTAPHRAQPDLRIGALEVLRVSEQRSGSCTVILAVHAVVPQADYERCFNTTMRLGALPHLGGFLTELLASPEVCGEHPLTLASDHQEREGWFAPPLLTLTWVPWRLSAAWSPGPGSKPRTPGAGQGAWVSEEVQSLLRADAELGAAASSRLGAPQLAVSGWQWSDFPTPGGVELSEENYQAHLKRTHLLSQSWAVAVGRTGTAYLARQSTDPFLCEGMLRACSTDLDIHLLVALDRLRVRSLSQQLADTAERLRDHLHQGACPAHQQERLDQLIDNAIALDSEAVAFLASEWWTNIAEHHRVDQLLAWMQEAAGLDDAVAQIVQQARLLRETVQTLIEREERRVDAERNAIERRRQELERERQAAEARQQQTLEWAVGVLAFIGVPLTVLLEIWINWDPGARMVERADGGGWHPCPWSSSSQCSSASSSPGCSTSASSRPTARTRAPPTIPEPAGPSEPRGPPGRTTRPPHPVRPCRRPHESRRW